MLMKHFSQWIRSNLLTFVIASEPFSSESFCRALFYLPPKEESAHSKFHDATFYLPDLVDFFFSECSVEEMRQSHVFATHEDSLRKIAHGESILFPLDAETIEWDDDLSDLRLCAAETWLALPSNTQWIESLVKDADFCNRTGKDESSASNLSMLRSIMVSNVVNRVKSDPECANSKRKKKMLKEIMHMAKGTHDTHLISLMT